MKNFSVKKPLLFGLLLLIPCPGFAGKIQCWVNSDGITECGNYIPPQYSQKGFTEYSEQGMKTKKVERAPTPEEIAEIQKQKEQELRLQQIEEQDRALLALFSTEADIEQARAAVLNTIDGQIQSQQTIIDGLEGNLDDLRRNYDLSKKNLEVSESQLSAIQRNITNVERRIRDHQATLQDKQDERTETQFKYDTYLQRHLNIQLKRLQKEPSFVSQSQLITVQGKIDEVKNRFEDALQQYLKKLQDRINNASLSKDKSEAIQAKINDVKKTYLSE
jgi:septal ring factor EnvC (AmiA/AmiB activator)